MTGGPTPSEETRQPENFVRALDRGLAVIRAFTKEQPNLTLSEVARSSGLTRAAARRFVLTLVELGYVGIEGQTYHLRPRVLELGFACLSSMTLPDVARPHLSQLTEDLSRSVSIAVLDGQDVVFIDRIAVRRILAVGIGVGTKLPAYLTSHGRMLLACTPPAHLDSYLEHVTLEARTSSTLTDPQRFRDEITKIRAQGWSLVENELEDGVSSLAVPIRDTDGQVVASINVAESFMRTKRQRLDRIALKPLLATAMEIERDLKLAGYRGHSISLDDFSASRSRPELRQAPRL